MNKMFKMLFYAVCVTVSVEAFIYLYENTTSCAGIFTVVEPYLPPGHESWCADLGAVSIKIVCPPWSENNYTKISFWPGNDVCNGPPSSSTFVYDFTCDHYPNFSLKVNCTLMPPLPTTSSVCFPAHATVQLQEGGELQMDELEIGHTIRVGLNVYSDVFMFSHQLTDAKASFVEIDAGNESIRLTPGHYLYVNGKATQASTVKVGDHLETADGRPVLVTGITHVRDIGLYNPHTLHGDVIVNGFRTTTYTDAINPLMAHALLAPLRALYVLNVTGV